jgi:hypothetical protein
LVPDGWSRRPVLAVPLLEVEGRLDGQLTGEEWRRTSQAGGLMDPATGVGPRDPAFFRVYWTREALHIGFRVTYPKWQHNPKATLTAGHHAGAELYSRDDNIEITLVPCAPESSGAVKAAYVFAGNAAGGWSSQRVDLASGRGDTNWKPDWSYKTAPGLSDWSGELKVPFASLAADGVPAPRDGTVWQMELMSRKVSLGNQIVSWANMWFGPESGFVAGKKGLLRFVEKPLAFQVASIGRYDHGGRKLMGYRTIILNSGTTTEKLRLEAWVFRAPKGRPKGRETFLDLWDKAALVKAGRKEADFPAFRTWEKFMEELNEIYHPYNHRSTSTELKPGGASYFAQEFPLEEGEYLVAYRVADEQGRVLGAQVCAYLIAPALELELVPYFLYYRKLGVTARLGDVPNLTKGDLVRCALQTADGRQMISRAETTFDGAREETTLYLDAALRPGRYRVEAGVWSSAGQQRVAQTAAVERPPDPDWWIEGRSIGREPLVPWPWTPVEEKNGTVSVWGRRYIFGGAPMPRSIETRGAELLAGPVELLLRSSSRQVAWAAMTRQSNTGETVTFAGASQFAAVHTQVEFDGMMRFDVTLRPVGGMTGIEVMELRIPVKPAFATLLTSGGIRTAVARHKIGDNEQGSLNDFFRGHPDGAMPFARDVMLLCEDRAIQWFAESDRGWENADSEKAIRVERAADRVTLVVSFIGRPVVLREPRTFTWGLIVTPVKPPVWKERNAYNAHAGLESDLQGRTCQKLLRNDEQTRRELADEFRLYKECGMGGIHSYFVRMQFFGSPRCFDAEQEKLVRCYSDLVHAAGLRFQGYGMWGVSGRFPGFEHFGKEMLQTPFKNIGFGAYAKTPKGPFAEYHLHGLRHSIRAVGLDGIHVDGGSTPELDVNELAGHRWSREGEEHGTFPVFAMRDYLKRLYRLFQTEVGARAANNFGQGYGPMYYLDCFSDNRGVGEADLSRGRTLAEMFTPERFRAAYLTEPHGLRTTMHWWNWQRPPFTENEMQTLLALHNVPRVISGGNLQLYGHVRSYEPNANPWLQAFKIIEPYRLRGEFHGYWERRWLDAEPKELCVSYHLLRLENRALLVLGNWTTQPMTARFTVDPARLSLRGEIAEVRDALLETPISQQDGRWRQEIGPQGYRLIEVRTK